MNFEEDFEVTKVADNAIKTVPHRGAVFFSWWDFNVGQKKTAPRKVQPLFDSRGARDYFSAL